jgi:hypothetical protein
MRTSRPKPAAFKVHPHLVDRLMGLYCDWRTECAVVQATYDRFADAEPDDRALAHAAYKAALDREGSAADAYGAQIRLIRSVPQAA